MMLLPSFANAMMGLKELHLLTNQPVVEIFRSVNAEPEIMSTDDFAARENFTWTENLYVMDDNINYFRDKAELPTLDDAEFNKLALLVREKQKHLALLFMGEKFQWGVRTSKLINKDEAIAWFSGEVVPNNKAKHSNINDYGMLVGLDEQRSCIVDPLQRRNIAGFFQHAPQNLDNYKINRNIAKKIATANLRREVFIYNNLPLVVFYATKQINLGEILVWDYGFSYWASEGKTPALFYKNGELVDEKDYPITRVNLLVDLDDTETAFDKKTVELAKVDFFHEKEGEKQLLSKDLLKTFVTKYPRAPYVCYSKTCSNPSCGTQALLMMCPCRLHGYCNKECQKAHWPHHKLTCPDATAKSLRQNTK